MDNQYSKPKELEGWQGEDPRFDPNEPVSARDFRAKLVIIGSLFLNNPKLQSDIAENLAWASGFDDDTIITWRKEEGGVIKPVVTHTLRLQHT